MHVGAQPVHLVLGQRAGPVHVVLAEQRLGIGNELLGQVPGHGGHVLDHQRKLLLVHQPVAVAVDAVELVKHALLLDLAEHPREIRADDGDGQGEDDDPADHRHHRHNSAARRHGNLVSKPDRRHGHNAPPERRRDALEGVWVRAHACQNHVRGALLKAKCAVGVELRPLRQPRVARDYSQLRERASLIRPAARSAAVVGELREVQSR
mmetsp:Transcript_16227/g.61505  ORF Transcript_16227/g.61505 Transcript_16227/m.61505 type:complete len:208 (-) Transcript_16227:725-1348(-)